MYQLLELQKHIWNVLVRNAHGSKLVEVSLNCDTEWIDTLLRLYLHEPPDARTFMKLLFYNRLVWAKAFTRNARAYGSLHSFNRGENAPDSFHQSSGSKCGLWARASVWSWAVRSRIDEPLQLVTYIHDTHYFFMTRCSWSPIIDICIV